MRFLNRISERMINHILESGHAKITTSQQQSQPDIIKMQQLIHQHNNLIVQLRLRLNVMQMHVVPLEQNSQFRKYANK